MPFAPPVITMTCPEKSNFVLPTGCSPCAIMLADPEDATGAVPGAPTAGGRMSRKKVVSVRTRVEALEKRVARESARRKRAEKAFAASAARQPATSEILGRMRGSPRYGP